MIFGSSGSWSGSGSWDSGSSWGSGSCWGGGCSWDSSGLTFILKICKIWCNHKKICCNI